ncbi:MAG: orotate phosphoribosyltransferase [Nitrospiraceae bacterium]
MIALPIDLPTGVVVNPKLKKDLARAFITTQSFKSDPSGFKLASGAVSPYYVDCRVLMAHPGPRHLVAQLASEVIRPLSIQSVGGLEIGAIAIVTAISDQGFLETPQQEWRTFVVRKQPKDHGLGKLIEGAFQRGDQALVVDDVLTSGGSVIKAIAAAREAGMQVAHALVIVDREEQDGRARVEEQGVKLLSLLTIKELLAVQPEL